MLLLRSSACRTPESRSTANADIGEADVRSERWFGGHDVSGLLHRSALRAAGLSLPAGDERPVIGICNSWSELVNCNVHFRALAEAVKRGVARAGGLALEFNTLSLGEQLMKPTTMLYRNLMAMEVEECLRAHPLDAVVLLGGCDKTIPAQLLGAASADVPAIAFSGGPATPAVFRGSEVSVGTDLWRYTDQLRAGQITQADYGDFEAAAGPSPGHCPEMGTASTMAAMLEGLGMALPGSACVPAMDARRLQLAEATGSRAVALAHEGLRPSPRVRRSRPRGTTSATSALAAPGSSTSAAGDARRMPPIVSGSTWSSCSCVHSTPATARSSCGATGGANARRHRAGSEDRSATPSERYGSITISASP
jgi:dihydroxyacid dehydratase/phosphogluconate dehydratase